MNMWILSQRDLQADTKVVFKPQTRVCTTTEYDSF